MTTETTTSGSRIERWIKFFSEDLWRLDFSELTRARKSSYQALQVLILVTERFFKDRLMLRASALTYSTMLSIVPLLAFMFSILKGIGVQKRLEPIILERVAVGSQETVSYLLNYIDKVNVGSLGVVGLVLLIFSVVLVLSNIEDAFNDIWGITQQRSYLRKFSDYLALMVVSPIFLLLALSVTATLKSMTVVLWLKGQPGLGPLVVLLLRMVPYASVWFLLTFLYRFLPNTKVRLSSALLAGILTGTVWQGMQWFYITFQVGVAKYNAIYGTFAQLPVMLVWIYISWVIVLFGAELTYALQNVNVYRRERKAGEITFLARVEMAWACLRDIHARFSVGEKPWTAENLARHRRLPLRSVEILLEELVRLGYLLRTTLGQGETAYVPAQDFHHVAVLEVMEKLEHSVVEPPAEAHGAKPESRAAAPAGQVPEQVWIQKIRASRHYALDGVMLIEPEGKIPHAHR